MSVVRKIREDVIMGEVVEPPRKPDPFLLPVALVAGIVGLLFAVMSLVEMGSF